MNRKLPIALITLGIALSAATVFAQDASGPAILRSEIRTALLNDPRSLQLSEGELAALVELLAGEAEAQEIALDFIPPGSVFYEDYVAPLVTPWGSPISQAVLYGVVLFFLGLALLLVKRLAMHHGTTAGPMGPTNPPLAQ